MCDEKTLDEMNRFEGGSFDLTRRQFAALSVGAGLSVFLPGTAQAAEMVEREVDVTTPDGTADCYFVHPAKGTHPGVLIWPDAFGLRPAFELMAKRLATSGYAVLVVNPYYRRKKGRLLPEGADFADPETRKTIMSMMSSLNGQTERTDSKAFIDFLDAEASVSKSRKMGTTGYCMGGSMTMRTAASRADRIGAAASFHGGRLVTEGADSPHLLIPQMKAHYLVAIAENDDEQEPETKNVLREAFKKAGLPAEIEVYSGALHGWCPPDSRVYNEAQAERAWSRLLALFANALA